MGTSLQHLKFPSSRVDKTDRKGNNGFMEIFSNAKKIYSFTFETFVRLKHNQKLAWMRFCAYKESKKKSVEMDSILISRLSFISILIIGLGP